MANYDVITSGYVSMDHIIHIKSPAKIGFTSIVENKTNTKIHYGGCSVNIAYALCKLGKRAMPILRVGKDYETIGFKNFLIEGNVPMEGIKQIEEENTSTCYLLQDNKNDHITCFYPGAMDGKYADILPDKYFEQTKLAVITVASQIDNREVLRQCKKHNIPILFGMKDDFDAFPDDFLKELLLISEIIFMNQAEREVIEQLLKLKTITDLFELGNTKIIITTLGKEGSIYYQKKEDKVISEKIGIYQVNHVVDATGSGDAYIAGFIYGYLDGKSIADCCRLGGCLSSFVLEKEGCLTNIPDETELLNRLKHYKTV